MTKTKFSNKKLIRAVCIFIFIQILFVSIFCVLLRESKPIDLQNTKNIDITVDDVYYYRTISEYRLAVYSSSVKYVFTSRTTGDDYSVSKLHKSICVGDKLSIIYYEKDSAFGSNNIIVDARTVAKTYRSFEEYNKGKQGLPTLITVIFSIGELVACGVFGFYVFILKRC